MLSRNQIPIGISIAAILLGGCGGSGIDSLSQGAFAFPSGKGGQLIAPSFAAIETDAFSIVGTKNIIVTALGIENATPSQSARAVALYDASGNVLVTTTVSTSDNRVNGYFYKQITPITLVPGSQYFIGELHFAGATESYIWNTNVATTPSYIHDIGTCYSGSASITNGTNFSTPGTPRHYSASFQSHEDISLP